MNTHDIKLENWEAVQSHLTESRLAAWTALTRVGAVTSRELAESMQIDPLTVRPRLTELLQMGFVELVGKRGHEGVYRALSRAQAQKNFEAKREETLNSQLSLL